MEILAMPQSGVAGVVPLCVSDYLSILAVCACAVVQSLVHPTPCSSSAGLLM